MPVDLIITVTEMGADGVYRDILTDETSPTAAPDYNPYECDYVPWCDYQGNAPMNES